VNYIGIRADESHRKGYISTKPNITALYPFIEAGIVKADVFRILHESGLGLPKYYDWRSRSGCYFCFFQRRIEWVGLLENHPELFERAISYEKDNFGSEERYTWNQTESLRELCRPDRVEQIKQEFQRSQLSKQHHKTNLTLSDVFSGDNSDEGGDSCMICHL
jgi:hypothetical protein